MDPIIPPVPNPATHTRANTMSYRRTECEWKLYRYIANIKRSKNYFQSQVTLIEQTAIFEKFVSKISGRSMDLVLMLHVSRG